MMPERIAELEKLEAALKPLTDEAFNKGYEFGFGRGIHNVYYAFLRWSVSDAEPTLREERFALTEFARKFMEERWPKDIEP